MLGSELGLAVAPLHGEIATPLSFSFKFSFDSFAAAFGESVELLSELWNRLGPSTLWN